MMETQEKISQLQKENAEVYEAYNRLAKQVFEAHKAEVEALNIKSKPPEPARDSAIDPAIKIGDHIFFVFTGLECTTPIEGIVEGRKFYESTGQVHLDVSVAKHAGISVQYHIPYCRCFREKGDAEDFIDERAEKANAGREAPHAAQGDSDGL